MSNPWPIRYSDAADCWFIETPTGNVSVQRYREEIERRTEPDGAEITIRRKTELPKHEETARAIANAGAMLGALYAIRSYAYGAFNEGPIADPRRIVDAVRTLADATIAAVGLPDYGSRELQPGWTVRDEVRAKELAGGFPETEAAEPPDSTLREIIPG